MLFHEPVFVFAFLPLVLTGYLVLTKSASTDVRVWFLTIASLCFYAWWKVAFLLLLVASVAGNFLIAAWICRLRDRSANIALFLGVTANLLLLGVFKYIDFGVATVNAVTGSTFEPVNLALPLAISFFTFLQIAFLVDCKRGDTSASDFPAYALFVTFFPHLVAGPLVHHRELMPQFRQARPPGKVWEDLSVGATIFVMGLFKKLVIAPKVGEWSDRIFNAAALGAQPTLLESWIGTLAFTFQIYFDFSAYSDMAIGLSRMFGILLPVNFASPYKATSIIDFWRRWHITLSRFLRDYLYIPLGGNRLGEARRHINIMIVMGLAGLWHGAAWTFVLWGVLHGTMLVVNHAWQKVAGGRNPIGPWTGRVLTFALVATAWVPFRAETFDQSLTILMGMAGLNGIVLPAHYAGLPGLDMLRAFGVSFASVPGYGGGVQLAWLAGCLAWVWLLPNSQELVARFRPALGIEQARPAGILAWRPTPLVGVATGLLALWLMAEIIQGQPGEFIYFQF